MLVFIGGSLDFSKISRPLTNLWQKDVPFVFDDDCVEAFEILKKALISAPIVQPRDWNLPSGWWKTNSGAPLPGAPNVGFRVPADP